MINWIVSSSVLILAVILLRNLFKRKISLRLQYALWLLVAVRLLIPFHFFSSSLSVENWIRAVEEQPQVQEVMALGELAVPTIGYQEAYEKVVSEYEEAGRIVEELAPDEVEAMEYEAYVLMDKISMAVLIQRVAVIVWWLGVAGMGIVFLASNIMFGKRVKRTRISMKVAETKLPVYISDEIDTPCLFGFFRPSIYIPKSVAENETLLRHSLLHEMTHFAHGDNIWSLIRCVCLALHWYNPLVWKAATLSKQDAELACDEGTLRKLGERERVKYGETLIRLTCEKRQDLFVTATTMAVGKKSIKERIVLIARKPKVKVYALVLVTIATLTAVGCTFTGGREIEDAGQTLSGEISAEPEENTVGSGNEQKTEENASTVSPDNIKVPEEQESVEVKKTEENQPGIGNSKENLPEQARPFSMQAEKDKVCLAIMLDGISKAGGDYRYIIPTDQESWLAAYEDMKSHGVPLARPVNNVRSQGIWIRYNDEWTEITEQGFIVEWENAVEKKDAEDFYNLCMEEAKRYGSGAPIRPEEISGLISARLEIDGLVGIHVVRDEEMLKRLEKSFSKGEELRGGAACPFTAEMKIEWGNGRTETIYLATDSCAVWMSDGVYYTYSDFEDINALTKVMKETEAAEELRELEKLYMSSIDWEGMKTGLAAEDFEVIQKYMPILQGGEFTWIYRSGEGEEPDTYTHAKKQTTVLGILQERSYETQGAAIYAFCFADVFQTGKKNLCLQIKNWGHDWIILHEENGVYYGVDMPVRWFQGVQEDGLYSGSGGADYHSYHRMQFEDGDYTVTDIGTIISGVLYIDGVAQSSEEHEKWEKENIREAVEHFTPIE